MTMAAEPAVTSGMPTHEALALLPVPDRLSDAQLDGHICVWGGEALTTKTAIDLGSRKIGDRVAFLRGCRLCAGRAALDGLFLHSTGPGACQDCMAEPACETGRAFGRVI
ncbi:hypothetical protein, partial [Streptomyces sp. EN23]|uniref:hypothetical protein n=1 Tax=Streptomyces sp. EN23 TaxID=212774 RepID=UPI00114D30B8